MLEALVLTWMVYRHGRYNLRLGYVCQYFTMEYRGPVTNLMHELSEQIDVLNYSSREKHLQYYGGGLHDEKNQKPKKGLTLRRYDVNYRLSGLIFPKNLNQLLQSDAPDIIQCEEYYQPATHIAAEYAKKHRLPFIINHRASDDRTRTLRERIFFTLANPLSKSIVKQADAIITLTEVGKETFLKTYPFAENKIHVIPNSINPKMHLGADGLQFKKTYNLSPDAPLIVNVARLHPQKRIDLLVEAFSKIKKEVGDAILCIVGPSFEAEQKKIDALIQKLKVEDIIFTGPIPNENVKNAYAAADVCALTSEYEPFGYSLLEGMIQSKPQITFDIGAMKDIVGGGGYNVPFPDTFEFAKKTVELLKDDKLRKKMGEAARKQVDNKFNITENSKKIINLYNELV